jgi:ribosomal protein S17E
MGHIAKLGIIKRADNMRGIINNRKGIIRIIEATIAIIIILGVILVISSTRRMPSESDMTGTINSLLEELSRNDTLREEIVTRYDLSKDENNDANKKIIENIMSFLDERITNKAAFGYTTRVCDPGLACGIKPAYPEDAIGDVFSNSRTFSSTLEEYAPKNVKLFIWRRK